MQGGYIPDIKDTLSKSAELIRAQPCTLMTPKLVKDGPSTYRVEFKKAGIPFEVSATIQVPAAYPDQPTTFTVQVLKAEHSKSNEKKDDRMDVDEGTEAAFK